MGRRRRAAPPHSDSGFLQEEIYRQRRQRTCALKQSRLVDEKARRVVRRGLQHVVVPGRDVDELEQARHFLLEVGEVLRHHHAPGHRGAAPAADAFERRDHSFGEDWIVHGHRHGLLDPDVRLRVVGFGDLLDAGIDVARTDRARCMQGSFGFGRITRDYSIKQNSGS